MKELYLITNDVTGQYYHSMTPRGYVLWTKERDQGQLFTEEEAQNLCSFIFKHELTVTTYFPENEEE